MSNLELAFWKAQRGKSGKLEVRLFRERLAENLNRLREELLSGNVTIGNYHYFTIKDPKERLICAASFQERVLHHAIINVCESCFEKYQIYDSYACRKGKGVDACLARAKEFCRRECWFLKLDIRKYYDSIDHTVLKKLLMRRFKDPTLLSLFFRLIDSYKTTENCGLPIGNLTSQYFANFYLAALDHEIKEVLHTKSYLRYMDDMVLFADSKAELTGLLEKIKIFLSETLHLTLKMPVLNRTSHGLPFLGYNVFGNFLRLSQKSKNRFRRKVRSVLKTEDEKRILPLLAFVQRADSKKFRQSIFMRITTNGSNRVKRGGSWNNNARNCRSANRNYNSPGNSNNNLGFRVALVPAQVPLDGCPVIDPVVYPVPVKQDKLRCVFPLVEEVENGKTPLKIIFIYIFFIFLLLCY